jgi:predicted deacylase
MLRTDHPLISPSLGVHKTVTSLHFGTPGARPKVYIQASLHAEELPGMLVAHHLRKLLADADQNGDVIGEVILVPVANPIGLAQRLDHKPMGRFELDTAENFNRHYPDFAKDIEPLVTHALSQDAQANVALVRAAMQTILTHSTPSTELQSLRKTLLGLAFDADLVLDLHCDCEAVMHLYAEEACWPPLEPLADLLQCQAVLLAKNSGGGPFDECLSGVWWQLKQMLIAKGLEAPMPQACSTTTVELRGEANVDHGLAVQDSHALWSFLQHTGAVRCPNPVSIPPSRCVATPLAGSETLTAPVPGLLVFTAAVGQHMQTGDRVAEIIDPTNDTTHPVLAGVSGVLYARVRERYVTTGGEIGKIAGAIPFRTGELLGA